jgi:glycosyltransferase involved in cell wall biosynthesis
MERTKMPDFAFLDLRKDYDARAFGLGGVGGVQSGTIRLAEALVKKGNRVAIYNDRSDLFECSGVEYFPLSRLNDIAPSTVAISNNNVALVGRNPAQTRIVWVRNNLTFGVIRKKKYFLSMLTHRPHLVFPSRFAAQLTPWYLPFRSRRIIEHGIEASFIGFEPLEHAPTPIAIFASQPVRNLKMVVETWLKEIRPAAPQAKLYIYHPKDSQYPAEYSELQSSGVEIKGSVSKGQLAAAMRSARVMIYPGHRTETFCNVAAESLAVGLPVVTMGIGALRERVQHNIDGYVSGSANQMGRDALRVLTDDDLWWRLHRAALAKSQNCSWDHRATQWLEALKNL